VLAFFPIVIAFPKNYDHFWPAIAPTNFTKTSALERQKKTSGNKVLARRRREVLPHLFFFCLLPALSTAVLSEDGGF